MNFTYASMGMLLRAVFPSEFDNMRHLKYAFLGLQ